MRHLTHSPGPGMTRGCDAHPHPERPRGDLRPGARLAEFTLGAANGLAVRTYAASLASQGGTEYQARPGQPLLDGPGRDLRPRGEPELVEDMRDVAAGRPLRDHQLGGDLAVGQPSRDQRRDFFLARTQRRRPLAWHHGRRVDGRGRARSSAPGPLPPLDPDRERIVDGVGHGHRSSRGPFGVHAPVPKVCT